jgi:hypothetical protein
VLRLIGAGVVIAGGRNDTIARNVIRDQGAYGIVLTPFPWLGQPATPSAHCQGGLQATIAQTPLCFFDDYGNLVAGNRFAANGFFGNATNGDLADAGRDDVQGSSERSAPRSPAPPPHSARAPTEPPARHSTRYGHSPRHCTPTAAPSPALISPPCARATRPSPPSQHPRRHRNRRCPTPARTSL